MGALFAELDLAASLTAAGLPVEPIRPGSLPAPARDLLAEWAIDIERRREEARAENERNGSAG